MKSELEAIANAFDELIHHANHENGMKLRATIATALAKCEPIARRIIQIAEGNVSGAQGLHGPDSWTMALCNDGSVWSFHQNKWAPLPPIPQDAV